MRYKTCFIGNDANKNHNFSAMLRSHSSFAVDRSGSDIYSCGDADFVFSLYPPEDMRWSTVIYYLTQRSIPVVAFAGVLNDVPVLSINTETGVSTKSHFKRHAHNKGFCIMEEPSSPSCERLITLAETAVQQGYLMQRQAVFYQ